MKHWLGWLGLLLPRQKSVSPPKEGYKELTYINLSVSSFKPLPVRATKRSNRCSMCRLIWSINKSMSAIFCFRVVGKSLENCQNMRGIKQEKIKGNVKRAIKTDKKSCYLSGSTFLPHRITCLSIFSWTSLNTNQSKLVYGGGEVNKNILGLQTSWGHGNSITYFYEQSWRHRFKSAFSVLQVKIIFQRNI